MSAPRRVGIVSLGCAKNLVDAEIMLGSLLQQGFEITNEPAEANAIIVNTCSFIDAAQEESVDAILESTAVRDAHHRGQAVIVSGCMPQRFREELPKLLPEVDAFMGIDQVGQVGSIVNQAIATRSTRIAPAKPTKPSSSKVKATLASLDQAKPSSDDPGLSLKGSPRHNKTRQLLAAPPASDASVVDVHARPSYIPQHDTPRFRLTPRHFAYVKIAEGCNHPCSFCTIPRMRGSHRSRIQTDIIQEARKLISEGVRELNLISQDSTYYGLDLRPNHSRAISSPSRFKAATQSLPADASTLSSLLRSLNDLPGNFWIRLLYTHPAHWTDDLIQTIADCPKVARYVDMPLQHIDDEMLRRMRRETDGQYIRDLIARIRAGIPGIALRTTFIVGFPGETEARFQTLLDFIRTTRFERLGIFSYSKEDGTIAGKMEAQVPPRTRQSRKLRAMKAQLAIANEISQSYVGRSLKVLIENQATSKDLERASVSSWEHGLIRSECPTPLVPKGNYWIGRGEVDAPDIDGRVYVKGKVPQGEFAEVKVIGHTAYDLIAKPL